MLPTAASQKEIKQKKEIREETAGSLVPADEELMRFAKAMGQPLLAADDEAPGLE